ncbi:Max-like protein X [Operophtera brumata]|uniref:Max-like protein X n=1 Tax=Operophtera brumata TaxID=104452 RepID=A0A0L7LLU8_OPEBR|nr:Max-like protein X [Operophtera brumata]
MQANYEQIVKAQHSVPGMNEQRLTDQDKFQVVSIHPSQPIPATTPPSRGAHRRDRATHHASQLADCEGAALCVRHERAATHRPGQVPSRKYSSFTAHICNNAAVK